MDKIGVKRDEEISHVRSQAIAFNTAGFLWLVTPVMVSTLSFAVFCLTGGILTAPKARAARQTRLILARSPASFSFKSFCATSPVDGALAFW